MNASIPTDGDLEYMLGLPPEADPFLPVGHLLWCVTNQLREKGRDAIASYLPGIEVVAWATHSKSSTKYIAW